LLLASKGCNSLWEGRKEALKSRCFLCVRGFIWGLSMLIFFFNNLVALLVRSKGNNILCINFIFSATYVSSVWKFRFRDWWKYARVGYNCCFSTSLKYYTLKLHCRINTRSTMRLTFCDTLLSWVYFTRFQYFPA
jgi:hypothetical protein